MPIDLPNVTLVTVDSVAHDLTELAIRDSLEQITPKEVLIFTDDPEPHVILPESVVKIHPMRSMDEAGRVLWYTVPQCLRTTHVLICQYDGHVLDGSLWQNEWLEYDFVGARWPWYKENCVGNGGFSLRSRRLMEFLDTNREKYPHQVPEDDAICRTYRSDLGKEGFRFAPPDVADQFSCERQYSPKTFGYHGIFNWPNVFTAAKFRERILLANDYVRSRSEWREIEHLV